MAEFKAGMQRDYVVPLKKAWKRSYTKKANKAVVALKRFAVKHTRFKAEDVSLSNEVNEALWRTGKFHVPRKLAITLKESEGKIRVYLKGGKTLAKEAKARLAKEKELKEKLKAAKEEKPVEEKAREEEKKRKLEEKRAQEKAAEALERKRG